MKIMGYHIAAVQEYPQRILLAFNMPNLLAGFFELFNSIISDGLYLPARVTATNNKEIRHIRELAHIQYEYIFGFLVLSKLRNKFSF